MDAQQVRTMVEAAVQAAVAAALQDQNVLDAIRPPAVVVPAAPFAVTPSGAGNNAWDFTSSTGIKIYMASTAPFSVLYDGNLPGLRDFLRKVWRRAEAYGWTNVLMVNDATGTSRNLTIQHGCLTLEDVQTHAITYLRLQRREHQASLCLHKLLLGSITPKLANRLASREDKYTVNAAAAVAPGVQANPPIMKEDGTCMMYELIKMVSVETKATVSIILKKLNNLDVLMEKCKSNVEEFNTIVDDLVAQLDARSIATPPMMENLFEGYANCADPKFARYIYMKQEAYEDGTIQLEYPSLMKVALERYKVLVDKNQWMKKTEEQLEIIALKAQLVSLVATKPTGGNATGGGATKTPPRKDQKGQGDKFAWKLVAPKQGEAQEKTVNGKNYIYCPYHDTTKWVLAVNDKGIDHRTGCTKAKEAKAAAAAAAISETDATEAALAGAMEDVGTATVDDNP
ncbi:hypothetical protein SEMRO_1063_G237100.1 [Seminavis robusta]|uniref:Uncharacterized protein n=1 Tax=Seminavis robusta TaxID=568900 RepID=A0A9N8HRC8_9STRA|nr:hypothetical protein SEMRO_1063_G237100.1 [Seminavis robusta]|eukprot:Sro1063_g237100.1 n/a (456) ;mRNA; f:15784-17151